jgi:hypothetical protein
MLVAVVEAQVHLVTQPVLPLEAVETAVLVTEQMAQMEQLTRAVAVVEAVGLTHLPRAATEALV